MADIPFTVDVEPETSGHAKTGEDTAPAGVPGSDAPASRSSAPQAQGEQVWTVSQLSRRIRQTIEEALPAVAVDGEVSNFKAAASGHLYFNLKDRDAQIRCVMFRNAAQSLRFEVEDGLQVIVRGKIAVYEPRGEYQIQVALLEPKGAGSLSLAFEQLKRRLEAEGLFAEAAKKPLPFLPRRIGIVTSPQGAAVRDMLQVLERRFPSMPVLIHPTAVQGENAAREIAEAIAALNRIAHDGEIDLIIVGRGGGSVEDLWAFNEEVVARAIFASHVPIISAVGHEVDFTIADFVADLRAPTPSAAAELAVPNRADLRATVDDLRQRLFRRIEDDAAWRVEQWRSLRARLDSPEGMIRQSVQRVDDLGERLRQSLEHHRDTAQHRHSGARELLLGYRPDRLVPLHRREARRLERRLGPALRRHVVHRRDRFASIMELLDSLSPLTVMRRGYSVAHNEQGSLIRSVDQVAPGDALDLKLHDGRIGAKIDRVEKGRP
ncbi:MAG: exodeoxyribonuclease VII large subunit [SAR324 cluster bacterium]|nr:exodeoxyribonuclease VII large subunit [SAR324 cluster bacterium]